MDVPPAAGAAGPGIPAGAGSPTSPGHELVGPPPARVTPADVAHRLEVVETRLADLSARLDALSTAVPAAVQEAVATEVRAVSGELRHTVSQLGRLLVRDLGKLSQILAEHRDTIVEEIRGPVSGPGTSAEPPPTAAGPGAPLAASALAPEGEADVSTAGEKGAHEGEDDGEGGDGEGGDGEGGDRSWRRRRRAR